MKNLLEDFNIRFEQAEKGTTELEDMSIEIQSQEQKENRMMRNEQNLRDLWDTILVYQYIQWESEKKRRERKEKKI